MHAVECLIFEMWIFFGWFYAPYFQFEENYVVFWKIAVIIQEPNKKKPVWLL